jgi:hypothetical protein
MGVLCKRPFPKAKQPVASKKVLYDKDKEDHQQHTKGMHSGVSAHRLC